MARRLAFGYALIAAVWCTQAFALGLGDITIHSALNQKLNAEIELLETRGMSESEIVAQLASTEDFKRVGIERFFFLTALQFHVEMRDQDHAVLRVTSAQPITEPYLNFLVQVIWPNGRLLKEYTVLLDPPTYKEQPAPAVASPGRSDPGGGPAGRVERTPTRPDSQVSLSSAPRSTQPTTQSPPQDRLTGDSYGMTDRDDTLWKIAQRSRPGDGVSVQQNMLAIQRLNPEAFIGGNINLLKAGYKLRLPKEADVAAISSTEAIAEVAAQNQAWQAYRRGESLASVPTGASGTASTTESQALAGQVDATAKPTTQAAASGPDGELRIVAGDPSEKGSGAGGGNADAAALENELASAKEEADRIARERDEAKLKLDQATSQAEQAQRQIEVRDQQIAQMQEQLKAAKKGEAAATPTAAKRETGGIMALLASPLVLGGAAIVLVLIVVAGLMRARGRRRAEDEERAAFDAVEPMRVAATGSARARARVEEVAEEEPEPAEQTLDDHHEDEPEVPHHEGAQTSDVIGEADIYIAYGRYPQAVSLLLSALEDDPNRSDVRVKLLEVYAETKDEAGFESHMSELLARCDDNELLLEARELETKLREDEPVAATVTNTSKAAAATTPTLDDFQLDLDAEDDMPTTRSNAFEPREDEASDDLGGDLGIDFKTDDEPTVMRTQAASRAKADLGDVAVAADEEGDEFDLEDLEFEPVARSEAKTQSRAASTPDSDDAFEFLNEEDAATTKLDLARAYIDMGDEDGAREILSEVLQEGSNEQQAAANELLAKLK
jgi:pilus assembly protein FimV